VRKLQRFSPDSNSWTDLPLMQTARGHVSAVVFQNKIWVLAGRNPTGAFRTAEIYDPAANSWASGPSMQRVRSGFAAEVVNGKIVVTGGEVPGNPWTVERSTEVYDPATGNWTFLPDSPIPLHGVASGSWQNRFYLFAGSQQAAAAVNTNRAFYLPIAGTPTRPRKPGAPRAGAASGQFDAGILDGRGGRFTLLGRVLPAPAIAAETRGGP
jgi:N-acetylneuraminic acid mutarotase